MRNKGLGKGTYSVGALEFAEEEARVCCGDAEGFVEQRGEVCFASFFGGG